MGDTSTSAKEYESRLGRGMERGDLAGRVADLDVDRLAELGAERVAKGDLLGESNGVESVFTGDADGGLRSADIFGDILRVGAAIGDNLGTSR